MANDTLLQTSKFFRKKHAATAEKSSPPPDLPDAVIAVALLAWAGLPGAVVAQSSEDAARDQTAEMTKVRMTIEGTEITATLDDNHTARDFISLLPVTLTLEDYNMTEKVSDLPKRLSTEGAPAGFDPSIGDITYYAPWGNLALFYRDFGYARGLVRLGRIESGLDVFEPPGPLSVIIERAE